MPIIYKFDILPALKEKGYHTGVLRREKLFGERVIQQFRNKELVSWKNIEQLCKLLGCQPGDLLKYVE